MSEETKLSELITKESVDRMAEALKVLESIESVEIKTREQYENAAEIQKDIKKSIKDLEKDRTGIVKPFNDKVKAVNAKFKEVTLKLNNGASHIGNAMSKWYQEEERKRLAEQRKREAEAEKKRKAAEAAAIKEQEKAEQYHSEGREDMAEKAEARAESKLDEAVTTVAAEVEEKKVAGVSYRTEYSVCIEDTKLAVASILESESFAVMITGDDKIKERLEASIKRMVVAMKGNFTLDGVKITSTKKPVIRS